MNKNGLHEYVRGLSVATAGLFLAYAGLVSAEARRSWMDVQRSPEQRANLLLKQMTLDEKIQLVHGEGIFGYKDYEALSTPTKMLCELRRWQAAHRLNMALWQQTTT